MTTAAELVTELEGEAPQFVHLCLAVGFEARTEFVHSNEPNKVEKLEALMRNGGQPVGFIGVTMENSLATFHTRVLHELAGLPWPQQYLDRLTVVVGELMNSADAVRTVNEARTRSRRTNS